MAVVQVLLLSVFQLLLVCYVIGSSFKVVQVNHDANQNEGSCEPADSCSFRNLSCRFLSHIKRQPIGKACHSDLKIAEQYSAKLELNVTTIVYKTENVTEASVTKMAGGNEAHNLTSMTKTRSSGQMKVWLNKTDQVEVLQPYLQTAFDDFTKDFMTSCGYEAQDGRFSFEDPFHDSVQNK